MWFYEALAIRSKRRRGFVLSRRKFSKPSEKHPASPTFYRAIDDAAGPAHSEIPDFHTFDASVSLLRLADCMNSAPTRLRLSAKE